MIVIDTIFFILFSSVVILSLSGLGRAFLQNRDNDFFLNIFFGFILTSLLVTFIHFFVKINIYISLSILFLGLTFALKNIHEINKINKKDRIIYLIIFLILIPIFITQKYHEDFGYYHLPHIVNTVNEKIIFGLANANRAFVHNSIWLNIMSTFYLKDNFNFVTLPNFLIYLIFIIFSVNQITKNEKNISYFFLIVSIFYLILKFTRISEFGNDIPAIIFSILSIFYFLRLMEQEEIEKKKDYFFYNFSFAIFAILIKFSSIPIIIFSIFIFLKHHKILIKDIFKFKFVLIYSLGLIFFFQQFIYTGCFIFPSKISCLDVSWFDEYFLTSKERLELVNKSYFAIGKDFLSPQEYLKNFNWVPYWFQRNHIGILEHLLTMIVPLLLFLLMLKNDKKKNLLNLNGFYFFIFFTIIGFIFWFNFSPVYRFGIVYFLSLTLLATFFIYKKKSFSRKIFINFLLIFLVFNFSKNISRLIQEDKLFFGIKKIDNEYIENKNNYKNAIKIFMPDFEENKKKGNGWQGKLCWDIEFLCTKNKVSISKKK